MVGEGVAFVPKSVYEKGFGIMIDFTQKSAWVRIESPSILFSMLDLIRVFWAWIHLKKIQNYLKLFGNF